MDKTADTHYTDPHMDRRLKVYRDHNVEGSGNSIHCFFKKIMDEGNIITVNSADPEDKNLAVLQTFIERNGKPCCLNLITNQDLRFLKSLEKKVKAVVEDGKED